MAGERKIQEVFAELRKDQNIAATLDREALLSSLVLEVVEERFIQGLTQEDLARRLKTKQSAVSRFENLGRKPGLDFLQKVAQALGGKLFITIHGRYAVLVPRKYRKFIDQLAEVEKIEPEAAVEKLLVEAVEEKARCIRFVAFHSADVTHREVAMRTLKTWQEEEILAS